MSDGSATSGGSKKKHSTATVAAAGVGGFVIGMIAGVAAGPAIMEAIDGEPKPGTPTKAG